MQSSGGTQLPTLQRVLVAFGDEIAFEDTLSEALDTLFGGDSGADAGDGTVEPDPDATPGDPSAPTDPSDGGGGSIDVQEQALLNDAREAMLERDAALQAGDWAAFGEADARLTDAIDRLLELTAE